MTTTRRPAKLMFWAALVLITVVTGALAGEAATRWREARRSTPPGTMPTLYYPHRRLRPALVRNHDYFGWAHIDSLGLRGRDIPYTRAPGTVRILADGGSTTFDTAVSSDDSTWAAQLERLLSTDDAPVEVLNAGVPGYLTIDNLIRLQTELHGLRPGVVLQMQGHNDLYDALLDRRVLHTTNTPGEHRPLAPWRYWLARNSVLYGQLGAAWRAWTGRVRGERALPRGDHVLPLDSALDRGVESFRRDLTAYVVVARALGAQVILVEPLHRAGAATSPRNDAEAAAYAAAFPGVPPATVLEGYGRFREVVRSVGAAHGAAVIRTDDMGLDRAELFDDADPMHLNDRGARLFAERLAERLRGVMGREGA